MGDHIHDGGCGANGIPSGARTRPRPVPSPVRNPTPARNTSCQPPHTSSTVLISTYLTYISAFCAAGAASSHPSTVDESPQLVPNSHPTMAPWANRVAFRSTCHPSHPGLHAFVYVCRAHDGRPCLYLYLYPFASSSHVMPWTRECFESAASHSVCYDTPSASVQVAKVFS